LSFPINSASPNSRILSLPPDSPNGPPRPLRRPSTLATSVESEDDPKPERPTSIRRSTSQGSMGAASRGVGALALGAGATGGAAAVNGSKGKGDTTPLSDSSNEYEEEDSSVEGGDTDYEEATEGQDEEISENDRVRPRPGRRASSASGGAKKRTGPMSRAAKIANEKMEENVKTRTKLGKPLAQLTAEDVQLTEADVKEDISVVWKAM